jgi:hypothetical protein
MLVSFALVSPEPDPIVRANDVLRAHHYLGPVSFGSVYHDDIGVMVVRNPSARRLPADWLELSRWCITSTTPNAGSTQWGRFVRWLRSRSDATTLVSYSDPSAGHDGALYRACNWLWAPTWHRLRPPPTGAGSWDGRKVQAVKDRWVFPLRKDERPALVLRVGDAACLRRFPGAEYREPRWARGRATGGGGDFRSFVCARVAA